MNWSYYKMRIRSVMPIRILKVWYKFFPPKIKIREISGKIIIKKEDLICSP